ncbi:MAG: PBP1A family penicillin-binding protein [Rhodobacteraceae bacterium]|jgi:penicillin-binding protein 1A|nr:PBP1A family penicillin-binding protein [Paracoccaceae bacterium]
MAGSGKGQSGGRLVADRRYAAPRNPAPKATPPRRPQRPRKPRRGGLSGLILGFFGFLWRLFWRVTWGVTAITALALGVWVFSIYSTLPPVDDLLDGRARGSVTLLDINDRTFAYRGETFGTTSAGSVSQYLHDAVVATEDKRFYRHFGVSPRGIASAIRINMAEGRGPLEGNGGSTITQQVAKLLCLGVAYDASQWESEAAYEEDCRKGGIQRKIKEIPYAIAMEFKYTKEEILTIYFNRAYLGAGARGFEAAAERYFGKSAKDVTPAEAAMLAGLLKAPSRFAPTNNLQRAQDRAAVIVGLMEDQGYLTTAEAAEARANPASLSSQAVTRSGGFFADWVMETTPDFLAGETTEDVVMRTTLDPRVQAAAEEALAWVFENKVREGSTAQAAIVVMSADGAVRAMVGGRNTQDAGSFNRATQALRQTGSSFKPFVYAAALDLGYGPLDYIDDSPMCVFTPGSGDWCPDNYDREFKGQVTLLQALAESRNIPAVRLSETVGRDIVREVAAQFGINSDLADGPALALGASESTLIEMTGAYAGILNGGSAVTPYGLLELRIKGDDEALFGATGGIRERVISQQAAEALTYMMAAVITEGTGGRAQLGDREVAGKTGTTNSARDAWFVGFTADYVAGVWMGYDDNRPLTGVTGGGLPAEIWHEVMVRVNEGVPVKPLPMSLPEPAGGVTLPGAGQGPVITEGMTEAEINEQVLQDVLRTLGE